MLAVEVFSMILTVACIAYCMLLNRRIIQIQKYRIEMQKLFNDFDKTVVKSESLFAETKEIFPRSELAIITIESKANAKIEELELMINKADRLAEELTTIIISGNRLRGKLEEQVNENISFFDNIKENISKSNSGNQEITAQQILKTGETKSEVFDTSKSDIKFASEFNISHANHNNGRDDGQESNCPAPESTPLYVRSIDQEDRLGKSMIIDGYNENEDKIEQAQ